MTDDLFRIAIEAVDEIDGAYFRAHPETAENDLFVAVIQLYAIAAAMLEIQERGEKATADAIRAEIVGFDDATLRPAPKLFRAIAEEAFDQGHDEIGGTLARAYKWARAQGIRQAAALELVDRQATFCRVDGGAD